MGLPENNDNSKETEVKVKTEQEKSHNQKHQKKLAFTPRTKFVGSCKELMGQNFSGHRPNDFKATLDNIAIYVGDTYGHEMGTVQKARKEAIIPQPD